MYIQKVTQEWPGGTRMAWGYKDGLGVQEWPGGTRMTWGYKNGLGIQEWSGGTRMAWGYKNDMGYKAASRWECNSVELLSKQ